MVYEEGEQSEAISEMGEDVSQLDPVLPIVRSELGCGRNRLSNDIGQAVEHQRCGEEG